MPRKDGVFSVEVDGLAVLERRLAILPAALARAERKAVEAEVEEVGWDMRADAPFDTGDLRESIGTEFDPATMEGQAFATAAYAKYVEHGTEDTPAQPFAEPAAERSRQRFPGRVRSEVMAELRKIT